MTDTHETQGRGAEGDELQAAYARWLAVGSRIGFGALVVSFFVYMTQALPPGIAPAELPRFWGLPYAQYIAQTGAPSGWQWALRLGESDLLNFVGVAILGSLTLVCYLRVLPIFARRRERAFVAICVLEIVVLAAAASGLFFMR